MPKLNLEIVDPEISANTVTKAKSSNKVFRVMILCLRVKYC